LTSDVQAAAKINSGGIIEGVRGASNNHKGDAGRQPAFQ